jgi:hypothetical protein
LFVAPKGAHEQCADERRIRELDLLRRVGEAARP